MNNLGKASVTVQQHMFTSNNMDTAHIIAVLSFTKFKKWVEFSFKRMVVTASESLFVFAWRLRRAKAFLIGPLCCQS